MKEGVKLTDKLTVSVVKKCEHCDSAKQEIELGAHIKAPSLPTGDIIKGELVEIKTYQETWKNVGTLLCLPVDSPFGSIRTVSLVGPIAVLCKHCESTLKTVTKWE